MSENRTFQDFTQLLMSTKGIALVTGAAVDVVLVLPAQGIGWEMALRLISDGFDLAVNDISNQYIADKVIHLIMNLRGWQGQLQVICNESHVIYVLSQISINEGIFFD
ncbi:hypothetical protein FB451DRAFT_1173523 [Mycena latifolia]|nr:hypothetical protein FB451DRAFT_1173523 [Mycena latifolia]